MAAISTHIIALRAEAEALEREALVAEQFGDARAGASCSQSAIAEYGCSLLLRHLAAAKLAAAEALGASERAMEQRLAGTPIRTSKDG